MEKVDKCPICEGKDHTLIMTCKDYTVSHETFSIVCCSSCGFHFTNPRPTEKEIGAYYKSEDYISHSNTSSGLVSRIYQKARSYTVKRKYDLAKKYTSSSTILDYGCGTGEFLNYCKQNGMKSIGYEPSEARKYGIDNYQLDIYSEEKIKALPASSLGAITMWHVLEHVHRLKELIGILKEKLNDHGTLIVAVPNMTSWDAKKYKEHWAAYDVPRHLYHFQPKNIKDIFAQFNMVVIDVLPMKLDSFYVSLLSEKYLSGSQSLLKGFLSGLNSNLNAKKDSYSSQIYIIKKKPL